MSIDVKKPLAAYPQMGDVAIGGWRENREFLLKLLAGTVTPFGSILTAPQVTALVVGGAEVSWMLLAIGGSLMLTGLVAIPIFLWKTRENYVDRGISGRFIKRVDECIAAMSEYTDSERSNLNKKSLIQKITTEAISIIGNNARVCVYQKISGETEDGVENIYFELEEENRGDRNPKAQARPRIGADDTDADRSFIRAIDQLGTSIVVQNINQAPPGFALNPNRGNGYNSFIVSPITRRSRVDGWRATTGAVTIDFPGKHIIGKEMLAIVSAFTEMFAAAYEQTHDQPFAKMASAQATQTRVDSALRDAVTKGDDNHD